MNKLMTRASQKIEAFKKTGVGLTLTSAFYSLNTYIAHAQDGAGAGATSGKTDADGKNMIADIIGAIVGIFPWIGAFFVVAGVFKLVLAYRSDNPEGQTGAAKDIVIGAVFIIFKFLFWDAILKDAIF